jgi:hypothetical protein
VGLLEIWRRRLLLSRTNDRFHLSDSLSSCCCWLLYFDLSILENFAVGGTKLSGTIPIEFWKSVTKIYLFSIAATDLSGTLPTELGLWTKAEHFNMIHSEISGTIPTEIGLMKRLTWFQASSSRLSGTFPTELGLLTGLGKSSLLFSVHYCFGAISVAIFTLVVSHALVPPVCSVCLSHTNTRRILVGSKYCHGGIRTRRILSDCHGQYYY